VPALQTKNQRAESPPLPRGPYAIPADLVAADQRRRLLEALPLAVAEHGFEGTTVDQIVKIAQVRRNSFYEQFEDKRDCFAAAYEIAQERLLGVLTYQCYARAGLAERISFALAASLDWLGANPALTRLIVVEAPAASVSIAARHYEWLDRYSRLLRFAAIDSPEIDTPGPAVEPAVVGGVVSRLKQKVLVGETEALPGLCQELSQFVLSFFGDLARDSASSASSKKLRRSQDEPPQPQSPERSSVLEPA
jgi:AcrR family transcriptional regulator